jgi:hypothetical protein
LTRRQGEFRVVPIPENAAGAREFRASLGVYIIFTVIFGGLALAVTAVLLIKNPSDVDGWLTVATCLLALAFAIFWLSRFRLVVGIQYIGYATLLRRFRTIPRSEIVAIIPAEETGPFESPFTIRVITASGDELRINAKVFPRVAIAALLEGVD